MKISVATVCFNAVSVLEKTIVSVLDQKRIDFEYLIIDGGSTDGTIDVIKKYEDRITFWKSEPDKGVYDAMNKAIKYASGNWINFMNAGDYFVDEEVLFRVFKCVNNNYDVIFGDTVGLINGKLYRKECRPFYEHLPLHQSMGFVHQSSFVKLNLAKQYPFDLKYELAADYNMMISLYKLGCRFLYVKEVVAFYEGNGLSDKKKKKHIEELYEIDYPNRKINLFFSYKLYLINSIKTIFKPFLYKISPHLINYFRSTKLTQFRNIQ